MQLLQPFNAAQFDPTQGGTGGFPVGKHKVVAIKSEVKPTKGGDSGMVEYEAKIIEGEFTGVIGAIRFNLYSSSQQAVEIAHKQYSAFCHSVGVINVTNTEQTHNIPFIIDVGLQKEPNEKKYTEVKKFYDANGNEPGQHGAQGQQQQQNNSGFGNQGQQQQPQNNQGGGFGNQQQNNGSFGVANNVPMEQAQGQQQQTGFGPQGQQQQQQQQQQPPQNNGGGVGQNWTQNAGVQQNNNGGGNAAPAAGGWGQQRS